jgi:hypothetical protein
MNQKKKYILKPGKHQFAPKSPAIHDNENLTDAEAEWYLEKYPHIASLFITQQQPARSRIKQPGSAKPESVEPLQQSVESLKEIGAITNNP